MNAMKFYRPNTNGGLDVVTIKIEQRKPLELRQQGKGKKARPAMTMGLAVVAMAKKGFVKKASLPAKFRALIPTGGMSANMNKKEYSEL